MGFGSEILFVVFLSLLMFGPKQMKSVLKYVVGAKAKLDDASRAFKSQLAAELETAHRDGKTDVAQEMNESRAGEERPLLKLGP